MIKDSELGAACELARSAYLAGIDGVIIQDIGLASILRKAVPGLALHASRRCRSCPQGLAVS
ncbi:MAG: U32 family peptidase [Oscillospiraceae bacterium]